MKIFSNEVVVVDFNSDYHIATVTWDGAPDFEQYKAPFEFLISEFKEPVVGMISDIRKQGVVGTQMRDWLKDDATPRAQTRGLKFYGIISDSNVFKKYYVNMVLKFLEGKDNIKRKLFNEVTACVSWVKGEIEAILEKV